MDVSGKHTLTEFNSLQTGKASPGTIESLFVEVYGFMSQLSEISARTTPNVKIIQIQPWDKEIVKAIESTILAFNLGVTPIVNGMIIRCVMPEMSRERRQELSNVAHGKREEGRIKIRSIRRDIINIFKKPEKIERSAKMTQSGWKKKFKIN
jgi:ribosome recycling factor